MVRRAITLAVIVAGFVAVTGGVAFAHTAFEPFAATPGSIVDVRLGLANENPSGTTKVELFFPENIRIPVTVTPVDGWVGQEVGGTPTRQVVTWTLTGQASDDDPEFPLTLGPLPGQPGRLQFEVVQTYADGAVDRWIEPVPAGGPEPAMPGPVLELEPGTAGIVPPASSPDGAAGTSSTTVAPTTSSTGVTAPNPIGPDDDDNSTGWIIAVIVAIVIIAGVVAFIVIRRRNAARPT
jgi:uncharacterized protein YcnI